MIFSHADTPHPDQNPLWHAIEATCRQEEDVALQRLLPLVAFPEETLARIAHRAKEWIESTRAQLAKMGSLQAFLQEYDLASPEGTALMCLAEALLRIPDQATADLLISDRLAAGNWFAHRKSSDSLLVNAASWSLGLGQKLLSRSAPGGKQSLLARGTAALMRPAVYQGMKKLGQQFVMGTNIAEALQRAEAYEKKGYRYSYDMLGEAARTMADADRYLAAYREAILAVSNHSSGKGPIEGPGISIKLSALHPRYEFGKRERVFKELVPRLVHLLTLAAEKNINITLDAEESDRLELSLDILERVMKQPDLAHWQGLGLAVQAYQKRAPAVIDWLEAISRQHKRRLMVRLVKGAYWDSEIKLAQQLGLSGYPVFTRKHASDVAFLASARKLLGNPDCFYPQFGTHNAWSAAAIIELAHGNRDSFEFQCLHGMGQPLYDSLVPTWNCRIYAPVGTYQDLLAYLVRRLLENGANTSFIHQIGQPGIPAEELITDPVARITTLGCTPHPKIPLPAALYGAERKNSEGLDLTSVPTLMALKQQMEAASTESRVAGPLIGGRLETADSSPHPVISPANCHVTVGHVHLATKAQLEQALQIACKAKATFGQSPLSERAACLEKAADLMEAHRGTLMSLICLEGGRQITDAHNEVREAVDFCRYYAARAREDLAPVTLKGPTGENNQLTLHPRGVIACISPWNFPLAIFTGQVTAALAAGNAVIAKPAGQTPLVAAEAVRLLHAAGIGGDVLQLLPGSGREIGASLVADPRIDGIMLTGSTDTARQINLALASRREGPIVPLIAETGGQNAMIVDSSALPEQVVTDVMTSAFNSAGQRCSALRVLFVQEDIAQRLLDMLMGAMQEIQLGDPTLLSTDIGPVIDQNAFAQLEDHLQQITRNGGRLLYQVPAPTLPEGWFFRPCLIELESLAPLKKEVFGPILHVIRYAAKDLDAILDQIIATGYGLTLGIHSRIDTTIRHICSRMPVGNIYVNRNMIGATVGVQPFGGEGLSGTGPKAGGPHYLPRLCVERTVSVNTTASGGNTTLVSLKED